MRAARLTSVLLAGVAVGGGFAACGDATEIEVHIATDLPCDGLTTRVTGGRDVAETQQCGPSARTGIQDIGSIDLVPSGATDDPVTIVVTAAHGKSPQDCAPAGDPACIVARRKLRYIPRKRLKVSVELRAACLGLSCDPDSTCVLGACVPAGVDDPSLGAEADAASTYDAVVFADASPIADALADSVPDTSSQPDGAPETCATDVLVRGITSADAGEMTVGAGHLYYVASGTVHSVDIPARKDTPLPGLGAVRHVSADGGTLYYSRLGAAGVFLYAGGSSQPIDLTITATALYAAPGAAVNPYYTDGTFAYAGSSRLFSMIGGGPGDEEIVSTAQNVWVLSKTALWKGPIAPGQTSVTTFDKDPTGGGTWHDLVTNDARVDWLENPSTTPTIQARDVASGNAFSAPTTSNRLALTTIGLYHDTPLGLVRDSADFPPISLSTKTIDPNRPTGKIVVTAECVFFFTPSTTAAGLDIRTAPP